MILTNLCLQMKQNISLQSMHRRSRYFNILILEFIFDCIFGPKKDKLFYPVFVFSRVMSNAIYDFVLYMQSEGLSIPLIYHGTISVASIKNGIWNIIFYSGIDWGPVYFSKV